MGDFIMLDSIIAAVQSFAAEVVKLFPSSPFRSFLSEFTGFQFLGWLNWFFPVGACLRILSAWLVAVGLFYLYSIVARWVKIIGD